MNRLNPLIIDTYRAMINMGQTTVPYFNYLLIQVAVVMLWWPKRTLSEALLTENPPDSLLAIVLAVGITTAYYGLRIGTEEILLAGQRPLCAWVAATSLSLPRILIGYLSGRVLQITHALFLSSPLVLAVYSVGGGRWPVLGWCLLTVLVQAVFYNLLGALIHALVGQQGRRVMWFSRVALVLGYVASFTLLPGASQVAVSYELITSQPGATPNNIPLPVIFVALYVGASAITALLLYGLLIEFRRRLRHDSEVDNQKRDSHSHSDVDIRREH